MGNLKLSIEDKEMIEKFYINGLNSSEIRKRMGNKYNKDTIKKHIQRKLKHLKEKHECARTRDYIILKQTSFESNSEMGKKSFIQNNNSIYKQNKSDTFVINRKVAPITTFDTPNRLSKKEVLGF